MTCECGCGEIPTRGNFAQGHDQRLRTYLERRVGGLSNLRVLVESAEAVASGAIGAEEHVANIRGMFRRGGG